jgi:ribosomal protein S18 acetylase RimI-like enzyme
LIAEDIDEMPLGFIYLNTAADYHTQEKHGHISDLVVAAAGEGRGTGSILMNAGEKWAKEQGYEFLTLNVFGQNQWARKLYEKFGFDEDMIKYVKKLH